jgi:hypothetical protein
VRPAACRAESLAVFRVESSEVCSVESKVECSEAFWAARSAVPSAVPSVERWVAF